MSTKQEARRDEGEARTRGQEAQFRDRAHLSQQRRLKQATQFLHKDSADLLPLDSLKRLGTSKDLQPHSVIQRRLVEGNPNRLQGESPWVQASIHGQESRKKTSKTDSPALLVNCKCQDQLLRVAVDTGTQHNEISAGCLSRLGLEKRVLKASAGDLASGLPTQVEQLELQVGQETVVCSAQVVGKSPLLQQPWCSPLTFLFSVGQRQRLSAPVAKGVPRDVLTIPYLCVNVLEPGDGVGREGARAEKREPVTTGHLQPLLFSNGSCRC
uniref:Nuclear receptor interacting protein 2 n=1 Tax=Callithrix jacchus TaxID=9483 RepID=A0A8I3WBV5_CALJA